MSSMWDSDVKAFTESVRGTLARTWPDARFAGHADIARLWSEAAGQGWFELGGSRAIGELVAASYETGVVGAPLPLSDAFVATMLLNRNDEIVAGIASGEIRAVVSTGDDDAFHDGGPMLNYVLRLNPSEATFSHGPASTVEAPSIARPPWVRLQNAGDSALVSCDPNLIFEAASLLRLSLAARALGAAGHMHQLALEHARTRRQFGRVIGSFGGVQQRAAQAHIELTAGQGLLTEAVKHAVSGNPSWMLAAQIAVEHIEAAAPAILFAAHHTLAAQSYFEEHPGPWLFRRVHADVARMRDMEQPCGTVAEWLIDRGARLPAIVPDSEKSKFRENLNTLLDTLSWTEEVGRGDFANEVNDRIADAGLFGIGWPTEYGGRNATPAEQFALYEELAYRRVPVENHINAVTYVGEPILRHGTEEQKKRFLPLIRAGRMDHALGYSEAESGSDLASLRTRADREGDSWVINGEKEWSTDAERCNWVWLAVRTDQDAVPRHAGITMFLIPLNTPGITVNPHVSLSGENSCTVTYTDVRVSDEYRVGPINGGWRVITGSLTNERLALGGMAAALRRQLDDLVDDLRLEPSLPLGRVGSSRRARLGYLAVRLQAARCLVAVATVSQGQSDSKINASMAKVLASDTAEAFGQGVMQILGAKGALSTSDSPGRGHLEYGLRLSMMYVIGGGTNDIQKGLIARLLGLPRE